MLRTMLREHPSYKSYPSATAILSLYLLFLTLLLQCSQTIEFWFQKRDRSFGFRNNARQCKFEMVLENMHYTQNTFNIVWYKIITQYAKNNVPDRGISSSTEAV